ncbi:MAG: hypothetical protein A2Z97_03040, partial [Bdellovibrionales bacterium GWB1_52_6]
AGFTKMEAFTPFHIESLAGIIDPSFSGRGLSRTSFLPGITLISALIGMGTGFGMQYYSAVLDYPQTVAGRPHASWPAFIPITFEMTILFAGVAAVFGMLIINGLPRLHHPIFFHPNYGKPRHSQYILVIKANDPLYSTSAATRLLERLAGYNLVEVPLR